VRPYLRLRGRHRGRPQLGWRSARHLVPRTLGEPSYAAV